MFFFTQRLYAVRYSLVSFLSFTFVWFWLTNGAASNASKRFRSKSHSSCAIEEPDYFATKTSSISTKRFTKSKWFKSFYVLHSKGAHHSWLLFSRLRIRFSFVWFFIWFFSSFCIFFACMLEQITQSWKQKDRKREMNKNTRSFANTKCRINCDNVMIYAYIESITDAQAKTTNENEKKTHKNCLFKKHFDASNVFVHLHKRRWSSFSWIRFPFAAYIRTFFHSLCLCSFSFHFAEFFDNIWSCWNFINSICSEIIEMWNWNLCILCVRLLAITRVSTQCQCNCVQINVNVFSHKNIVILTCIALPLIALTRTRTQSDAMEKLRSRKPKTWKCSYSFVSRKSNIYVPLGQIKYTPNREMPKKKSAKTEKNVPQL